MAPEPLQYMPMEKWHELQKVFLSDWPRSLPGYSVLETQTIWKEKGLDCGIKVYCPFGDVKNGFIAVNEKASSYEIIVQYPKDDTKVLEETLRTTKIIDWHKRIVLPFTSFHVIDCFEIINKEKDKEMILFPSDVFILEKDSELFKDVSLPGCSFDLLSSEHVELVDSKWPPRYPTSSWYFQLLINTNSGYGLYKDGQLISWVFIGETGILVHLYTLEEHRRKGYAELILKHVSNEILKQKRAVLAFSDIGNKKAFELYQKVGFQKSVDATWGWLSNREIGAKLVN